MKTTTKKGPTLCSSKGHHGQHISLSKLKLKLDLENVISTHTKAPAFLWSKEKTK